MKVYSILIIDSTSIISYGNVFAYNTENIKIVNRLRAVYIDGNEFDLFTFFMLPLSPIVSYVTL